MKVAVVGCGYVGLVSGVGLASLAYMPRRSGTASIKIALNIDLRERKSRRTTVDNAADRRSMRLSERRDGKQSADGVAGHGRSM